MEQIAGYNVKDLEKYVSFGLRKAMIKIRFVPKLYLQKDMVQDAWLRILKKINKKPEKMAMKTWVKQKAYFAGLEFIRCYIKNSRREILIEEHNESMSNEHNDFLLSLEMNAKTIFPNTQKRLLRKIILLSKELSKGETIKDIAKKIGTSEIYLFTVINKIKNSKELVEELTNN